MTVDSTTQPSDQVTPVAPDEKKKLEKTSSSISQPVSEDQAQAPPVEIQSPPEATPSSSIGQQLNEWPNSTNLANTPNPADSQLTTLANDQPAVALTPPPVSVEEKPPETPAIPEPPKEEAPSQSIPSEIGQSVSSDSTWPDSTKMANDTPADSSDLANASSEDNRPISTISADSSQVSLANSPTVPTEIVPDSSQPASPSASEAGDLSSFSPVLPVETLPSQVGQSESSETKTKPENSDIPKTDTNISSADQQAPQVQSEAPNDAPNIDMEKTPDQMANFKPEPPEQPQEAPLANLSAETLVKENTDSQTSSQKSFGDLLSEVTPSPASPTATPSTPPIPPTPPISSSLPSVPSPVPSVSFGDLIKDIEITPPSIPEAQRPVEQPQTTPSSQYSPQSASSVSPVSSPSPQSPPSPLPVIDQNEMRKQFEEQSKTKLVENRIKANQVRSQKKKDHLDKIMELVRNTKAIITNTDIQRLLHVSQSTATNYLSELSSRGMLKRKGIRGGAKYSL